MITRLVISNFAGFDNKQLGFEGGRTLLIGENGSGKTTTQNAIRWLLTGRCRGLDKAGKGVAEMLQRDKTKPIVVEGELAPINGRQVTIQRTWAEGVGSSFTASTFSGTSTEQQDGFLTWLGVPSVDTLVAMLDSEVFFTQAHADAKTVLMELLRVRVVVGEETLTLEDVDARYESAFNTRKELKGQLKMLGTPQMPTEPAGDLAKTEAGLATLKDIKAKKLVSQAETFGTQKAQQDELRRLKAELEDVNRRIHVQLGQGDLPTAQDARQAASVHQVEVDRLNVEIAALALPSADELTPPATSAIAQAAALKAHQPKAGCVLSKNVACPVPLKVFKTEAEALEGAANEQRVKVASAQTVARQHAELGKALAKAKADAEAYRTLAVSLQDYEARAGKLEAEIERLAIALPVDDPAAKVLQEEIDTLTTRIANGEVKRTAQLALKVQHELYQRSANTIAAVKSQLEKAEDDVETYGPKGVRLPALEEAIKEFDTLLNAGMRVFGYTLSFTLDPWQILVNGRPLVTFSTSQRLRIGVAMQCAMAQAVRFPLVLVDNLDWLLAEGRQQVLSVVTTSPVEQILMVRAVENSQPAAKAEWLQVIRLGGAA